MPNVTINVPTGYAYFVTLVPTQYVPDLVAALAEIRGVAVPTDPEAMRQLAAAFTKDELHEIWVSRKAGEAAEQARDELAGSW